MALPYKEDSLICYDGTGSNCTDNYNKRTTVIKGQETTQFAQQASCAYNLPLTGSGSPTITIDNASGISTEFARPQTHDLDTGSLFESGVHLFRKLETAMNEVNGYGTLTLNDVQEAYTVSTEAFVDVVFPASGNNITLYRDETQSYDEDEVRVTWVIVLSILGAIFTCLSIFFIVKACKQSDDEKADDILGEGNIGESEIMIVNPSSSNETRGGNTGY